MRIAPTILLLIANSACLAQVQEAASSPESIRQSVIGYATVAEALTALQAKPGIRIEVTKPDSWTIINEPGNVQWSFTPSTHKTYPAVVRRAIKVNTDGGVSIEMSALCQAEKASCDKLMEDFKELNERIRQSVRARTQPIGQQR
jgi:hypothetical protein